jgi:hypothetical protein
MFIAAADEFLIKNRKGKNSGRRVETGIVR